MNLHETEYGRRFFNSQLVRAAAEELRAQGKRAKTSCWYAAQWFEKHPQEQDLLYKE